MARLCDAIEVPRIGAHPPEIFQLPSLSWFFSILATHFCRPCRIRALALASPIVPSSSARSFEVRNVSMYGPSLRCICVPLRSVTASPSAGLCSTRLRIKSTACCSGSRYSPRVAVVPVCSRASATTAVLATSLRSFAAVLPPAAVFPLRGNQPLQALRYGGIHRVFLAVFFFTRNSHFSVDADCKSGYAGYEHTHPLRSHDRLPPVAPIKSRDR